MATATVGSPTWARQLVTKVTDKQFTDGMARLGGLTDANDGGKGFNTVNGMPSVHALMACLAPTTHEGMLLAAQAMVSRLHGVPFADVQASGHWRPKTKHHSHTTASERPTGGYNPSARKLYLYGANGVRSVQARVGKGDKATYLRFALACIDHNRTKRGKCEQACIQAWRQVNADGKVQANGKYLYEYIFARPMAGKAKLGNASSETPTNAENDAKANTPAANT